MDEMLAYIGTKLINAKPMNREDYNTLRGWDLPENEDGYDEGYLVEYPDSNSNVPGFDGYISWSPKIQFENAYKVTDGMSFGLATAAMEMGHCVARQNWNGKEMFTFLVPSSVFIVNRAPLLGIFAEGTEVKYRAHIDMKAADGTIGPWLASQTDILATDWYIVDTPVITSPGELYR